MSNRLFVGNLSFQTTEEDLQQAFQNFGEISEIRLVLDRDTGRSRGFAFVSMADDEAARRATEGLNGTMLDGRPLRVNEAEDRRDGGNGNRSFGGGGNRSSGGNRSFGGGGRGGHGGRRDRDRRSGGGRW
ncbi:MAG TPA: RNA-binding protein, partial [Nannocystis sp.]